MYYHLEEATISTSYIDSIKHHQLEKNGMVVRLELKAQYADDEKWQAKIKIKYDLLHTRVSKGHINYPLENFITQHLNDYILIQQCVEHIAFQLPNEH